MRQLIFLAAMLLLALSAPAQTRTLQVVKTGQDSTGRDSIFIVETLHQATPSGWQETKTARLIVGKSEARQFIQGLETEAETQTAEIEKAKAQRAADKAALRSLRQQLNDSAAPPQQHKSAAPSPPSDELPMPAAPPAKGKTKTKKSKGK